MRTLKTICLLLCVILCASCGGTENEVKVLQKNVGLQMYSLRADINNEAIGIDSIINVIGAMGYKYVETASYSDGQIYGMDPVTFKQKCEAAGFYPLSCHVGRDLGKNPQDQDIDWDAIWAWWDLCIQTHKDAGMKYIVTPSMPTPDTLEGLQVYCDYYNAIGEKCRAAGMKFGYHNHAFEIEKVYRNEETRITMYDYMLQNTNPDNVFFQLDVYWSVMGRRSPVDLFKKYPGRFEVLHIKDDKELGESGMLGFDAIFKNLDKAGTKYLIVEVESYNFTPIESVKRSLDYLNNAEFVKEDYSK